MVFCSMVSPVLSLYLLGIGILFCELFSLLHCSELLLLYLQDFSSGFSLQSIIQSGVLHKPYQLPWVFCTAGMDWIKSLILLVIHLCRLIWVILALCEVRSSTHEWHYWTCLETYYFNVFWGTQCEYYRNCLFNIFNLSLFIDLLGLIFFSIIIFSPPK